MKALPPHKPLFPCSGADVLSWPEEVLYVKLSPLIGYGTFMSVRNAFPDYFENGNEKTVPPNVYWRF